jgi:alpha-1,2-mannosyltransferase
MALSAPFLFEEIVFAMLSNKDAIIDVVMRFLRGIVAALLVLVSEVRYSY